MQLDEQFLSESQLQEMLFDARKKARRCEEIVVLPGYKDFQEHIKLLTQPKRPIINNLDDLVKFTAEAIFNAGAAYVAAYFEQVPKDVKILEKQVEAYQAEYASDNDDKEDEV